MSYTLTGQIQTYNTTAKTGQIHTRNAAALTGQIGYVPIVVVADSLLLLETGGTDNLLLETGDDLLLES